MRFPNRGVTARIATIDAYRFPSSVRQRFAFTHPSLSAEDIGTVEAATRQWFRITARHPRARLAVPSTVVDQLWQSAALQTGEYTDFCAAAFGRPLSYVPAAAGQRSALHQTFTLAQRDEGVPAGRLPLLFRVDQQIGVPGGRHYLADCGGRGQCYELPGAVCLQHLRGPGRPIRGGRSGGAPDPDPSADPVGGAGCGGCGGGL